MERVSSVEMTRRRREVVAEMVASGKTLPQISAELHTQGIVNPRSGKSYSKQTLKGDIRFVSNPHDVQVVNGIKVYHRPLAETIGTWTYVKPLWNARILLNVDTVFKDYVFWDALRRGQAPGYQFGGLFCLPIAQTITSHMLGSGISAELIESATPKTAITTLHEDGKPTKNLKAAKGSGKPNNGKKPVGSPTNMQVAPTGMQPLNRPKPDPNGSDPIAYTNAQLRLFFERNQGFLQTVQTDKFCFGNQYVIVNPDCSLAIISPETVTVEYSASDYRHPVKYIIRTKMEKARVEDEYTAEKRTLTVHYYDDRGTVVQEFDNLIGRIPIVHFVCDRSANEIYGRPIYEAALPLMQRYDDLIDRGIEGVNLLGNPIPVFEGLDNVTEAKNANSVQHTYLDEFGNQVTETITHFDRSTGLWLGKGGKAVMLNPPVGFTKDTLDYLRQLFLLLLNHTRIPEFIWGGAIDSSKASAETQMPPFEQYIQFRRLEAEGEGADPALGLEARGGLYELIDIWLKTYKLLNPAIVVGPTRLKWPNISLQADQLKYMWGSYLDSRGYLTPEDTVALPGYWKDAAAVVQRALGKNRRQPQFDEYDAKLRKARLQAAKDSLEPPDDSGQGFYTDYITNPDPQEESPLPSNDLMNPFGPLQWNHMLTGSGY